MISARTIFIYNLDLALTEQHQSVFYALLDQFFLYVLKKLLTLKNGSKFRLTPTQILYSYNLNWRPYSTTYIYVFNV